MSVSADLILTGANVITVDEGLPRAEAVAVRGGTILAVGTAAEVGDLRGPATEILDLRGRTLLPGFHDAHDHMAAYGLQLEMVELAQPARPDVPAIVSALAERAAREAPGTWVKGAGYDNNKLPGGRHPTRGDLDRVSTDHLVFARHTSGHMCVVNSRVLELLGIDRNTPDPAGGHIDRDADGEATGLLQETAFHLVTDRFYPSPVPELVAALEAASRVYVREGITSHTEAGIGYLSPLELLAYRSASDEGRLQVRSTLMVAATVLEDIETGADEPFFGLQQGVRSGWGDARVRLGPIKMFSDGSLIGRTAALTRPYQNSSDNVGFFATPEETLRSWILKGHASGWQIAVHAIGDRAVSFILDCYEEAQRSHPRSDPRHRIEHCGIIDQQLLERIRRLGVIPVPQQRFIGELGDGFRDALGPERTRWCYVQRSFVEAGVPLPGSSDRYVVAGAPLLGIHDAVNQKTLSGRDYVPAEALTPMQAIRAFTLHSAYATFEEGWKGSITPGKVADFAVLGEDPTAVEPAVISQIPVLGTVIGGEVVHEDGLR
jgi:predicted amidohydrolase YtcJ